MLTKSPSLKLFLMIPHLCYQEHNRTVTGIRVTHEGDRQTCVAWERLPV